ncbi:MAG: pilus assembly protein N-terminal domain-containing protein [bacterium]
MIPRLPRPPGPRLFRIAVLSLAALATFLASPTRVPAEERTKIAVTLGQSVTQRLATPVKTVSIADTDVADVVVLGPYEILINGKKIGMTTLVTWDQGDHSTTYNVVVRGQFSEQKIELQVQLAEVNRTKARELGFDYAATSDGKKDDISGGAFPGDISSPTLPLAIFGGKAVEGADLALRWSHVGAASSLDLSTMIQALAQKGVIRLLAQPNVVAASGEKANFLSGGEIPVPVASTGTTGGSTVTIEWKEFGVKVDFLPTIVDDGVINLRVAPEVSSLDFGNGIDISGFRIPALRMRRAQTTVELRDRETLVIGGLMMDEESVTVTKIPILGDIPLLGHLFRSDHRATSTNELLLVVSPRIVRALPEGTRVPLPTDSSEPKTRPAEPTSPRG